MKIAVLTPILLLAISSCSGSNGETEQNSASDPSTQDPALEPGPQNDPTLQPESAPEPEPEEATAVITSDNHVELIANVFAIYSGKYYGDEILTAPDYSDPTYDGLPLLDGTGSLISTTANIVCSNGGTAVFQPQSRGFFDTQGWDFEFDNCQDGISLLDGQITRSVFESITLTSTGFSRDDQTQLIQYSGWIYRTSIGNGSGESRREWWTDGTSFSLESSDGFFAIEDSTSTVSTSFDSARLSGGFTVRADWTGGQDITVMASEYLTLDRDVGLANNTVLFETGTLELSAGANNSLLLDADTGDIDTVQITLTADGTTSTLTQPWSLWMDELIFIPTSQW